MNGGLAAPKHPEIPRHQVGAVASLPSHGQVVLQGHRVLPVPARQAAASQVSPPSLDQRKVAAPTSPVVSISTTNRRFSCLT